MLLYRGCRGVLLATLPYYTGDVFSLIFETIIPTLLRTRQTSKVTMYYDILVRLQYQK